MEILRDGPYLESVHFFGQLPGTQVRIAGQHSGIAMTRDGLQLNQLKLAGLREATYRFVAQVVKVQVLNFGSG